MHQPAAAIALQYWLKKMGYPRLIIAGFLLFLFIMAPITGSDLPTQITNVINRFSWNAVLVLAMVPMIRLRTELRRAPGRPGGPFGRYAGH